VQRGGYTSQLVYATEIGIGYVPENALGPEDVHTRADFLDLTGGSEARAAALVSLRDCQFGRPVTSTASPLRRATRTMTLLPQSPLPVRSRWHREPPRATESHREPPCASHSA